jgi:predicted transcriptional regulator
MAVSIVIQEATKLRLMRLMAAQESFDDAINKLMDAVLDLTLKDFEKGGNNG